MKTLAINYRLAQIALRCGHLGQFPAEFEENDRAELAVVSSPEEKVPPTLAMCSDCLRRLTALLAALTKVPR